MGTWPSAYEAGRARHRLGAHGARCIVGDGITRTRITRIARPMSSGSAMFRVLVAALLALGRASLIARAPSAPSAHNSAHVVTLQRPTSAPAAWKARHARRGQRCAPWMPGSQRDAYDLSDPGQNPPGPRWTPECPGPLKLPSLRS